MKLITQGTPGKFVNLYFSVQPTLTYCQWPTETDCTPALVRSLFDSVIREDLLFRLAHSMRKLPFEARKDTQIIITHILRYKPNSEPGDPPAIDYIVHHRPEVIIELCRGFDNPHSALSCAAILKEAVKSDVIAALILYDQSNERGPAVRLNDINAEQPQTGNGIFWQFFEWIDKGSFEVSADAFTIFRVSPYVSRLATSSETYHFQPTGPLDAAQNPRRILSFHQLQFVLQPLSSDLDTVRFLRDETTEYQIAWGDFIRSDQL